MHFPFGALRPRKRRRRGISKITCHAAGPKVVFAAAVCSKKSPRLLLAGSEAKPLGVSDFRYEDGDLPEPIRVTVDPAFFEAHSDSTIWAPS